MGGGEKMQNFVIMIREEDNVNKIMEMLSKKKIMIHKSTMI